ncbi:MAG: phospholipase D family protein [Burkholderiales bacterium]|nr:phospholipase D family protein [Burkholderiales bacterium]
MIARRPHPLLSALSWLLLALLLGLAGGCASLPEPGPRPVSVARAPGEGMLGRLAAAHAAAAAEVSATEPLSGLRLLPNGVHALDARLALVQRAEHSLDVQYYLIQRDDSGLQFLRALRDAAARGVRVRLLVDDLYTAGEQALFAGLAAHPNVSLRLYNPLPARQGGLTTRLLLSLHERERINHRMHNKLLVADGAFAIAGGRNIGDEYFMRSRSANFIDMDVLATGPVVAELAAGFDRYWNSERAWPIQALMAADAAGDDTPPSPEALRAAFDEQVRQLPPPAQVTLLDALGRGSLAAELAQGRLTLHHAPVRVLVDAPDKQLETPAESALDATLQAMLGAREEVLIASPYFVPGQRGLAMLRQARDHGIRIRVLTNSIAATDEPIVYWGYSRYRTAMLELGVTIHELSPELVQRSGTLGVFGGSAARLHAKVATIDRRWVALGSLNMDPRSARLNTELGLLIDSPALAWEVEQLMQPRALAGAFRLALAPAGTQLQWHASAGGEERLLTDEPGAGWLTRLKLGLMSLLISEDML